MKNVEKHMNSSPDPSEKQEDSKKESKPKLSKRKKLTAALERTGRQTRELLHLSQKKEASLPSQSGEVACSDDRISAILALECFSGGGFKTDTSARRWLTSFGRLDPRWQISRFFTDLEQEGARDIETSGELVSPTCPILRPFVKSSVFTIWRPTSGIAIRRMIAGEATGKGLEIKGKSAKTGKLSGFVPYLQIDKEEHKKKVGTLPRGGRTRVFFATKEARDTMMTELQPLQNQMVNSVMHAKLLLRDTAVTGLTPFSAASRMAGRTMSGTMQSVERTASIASDVAAPSVKSVERTLSKSSGVVASTLKPVSRPVSKVVRKVSEASSAALSGLNPLPQSPSSPPKASGSHTPTSMARKALQRTSFSGRSRTDSKDDEKKADEDEREWALTQILFDMDDPSIKNIDKYAPDCYGIELPDRMLWASCVADRNISRPEGSEYYSGRPSEPAFQDMNFKAIWKTQKKKRGSYKSDMPRVVLWQTSGNDVMDPRGLIMAYEENRRVLPVVSDFDCFTVGTRGVEYERELPSEQADLVSWEVNQIEAILDAEEGRERRSTWTSCWLNNVLKPSALKGFMPAVPRFGFGDPKSYAIMECAVGRLSTCGAVRHGAECFNYFFPQELDDEFLIVSDTLPGNVSWQYANVTELQEFLSDKIDEGFTFPLNPKWVLCDQGWKKLYDRLLSSDKPNVQESLNIWFPPKSGIRERIESIHERNPRGFIQEKRDTRYSGTEAMDLASLELDRYLALRRAKMKLRAVVAFNELLISVRKKNAKDLSSCAVTTHDADKEVDVDPGVSGG